MTKTSPSSQTEEERTYTEDEYIDYGVIQYRRGRAQAEAEAEARSTPAEALPLFDPESEHCHQCGQPVGLVWTAPDDLWSGVTGITDGGGIRCIPCFDKAASEQGRFIRWVPQQEALVAGGSSPIICAAAHHVRATPAEALDPELRAIIEDSDHVRIIHSAEAHRICPDCNEPITDAAHWHEDEAAVARLRSTPAETLDVERLGQAIEEHIRRRLSFHHGPGCEYDCRTSIAAEYARLSRNEESETLSPSQ